jgi:hypothetical protein
MAAVVGVAARRPDPIRPLFELDQLTIEECMEPRARQAGVQGRFGPALFYEKGLGKSASVVPHLRKSHFQTGLATEVNPQAPDMVSSSQELLERTQTIKDFKAPRMDDQRAGIGGL